ncbi:13364_t:CDS:2 [Gigaspora rosea]|nr:13364_t:CDS:2 [Gigaspora rosea]
MQVKLVLSYKRDYGDGLLSWVKLVDETNYNLRTELYIEWAMKGFHDASGHNCYAGNVKFRFLTDNAIKN